MTRELLRKIEAVDYAIAKCMKLTILVSLKAKRKRLVRRLNSLIFASVNA